MTNKESKDESSSSNISPTSTIKISLNLIAEIAIAAFKKGPPWLKFVISTTAITIIAAICFGGGFFFYEQFTYALISFLASISLVGFILFILKPYIFNVTSTLQALPGEILFSHVLLKISETNTLDKLGDYIENIRLACLGKIKELQPELGIDNGDVRGNVFMPDYHSAGKYGCVFKLYMPAEVRRQMNHVPEHGLVLLPEEGVSGQVFVEGGQKILPHEEMPIKEPYKELLHPELKWIISTPIKSVKSGKVLAVLNIDVLKHDLDPKIYQDLGELIKNKIRSLETEFDKFEKVDVYILKKEARED